ncbi:MAG: alpha-glucan family phosphorylase [Polyangiaceae bacterium]
MPTVHRFNVVPRLPAPLERLRDIAYNLWWAWAPVARDLFQRIDPVLWEEVHGNPIALLTRVEQKRLDALATDDAILSHLDATWSTFQAYMSREGWFQKQFPDARHHTIAYFSMEYGLHESLPIYSGGLGVLAGDHLKTASDLGLPLVGVGLAYAEGYFRQVLSDDGWQTEKYPLNDWPSLPVLPVLDATGKRLIIQVAYPDRIVHAQLWRVQVGRVPLLLLDANLELNAPADRSITGPLYGGDQEFRVRQEIMLGIGGVHALAAIGVNPTVCHMNEGHSAFLAVERIARLMRDRGATFAVAKEANSAGTLFTTHTPVPAGNDSFKPELVKKYLEPYRAALGITEEQLLAMGRLDATDKASQFSMPVLAIRTSDHYNGVSALHGVVSRKMWKDIWPELPNHEVPIGSVTNGVHIASWVSSEHGALYTRYLGPRWADAPDDVALWKRVYDIPDVELWQVHEHRRHRLVTLCRARLRAMAERRARGEAELKIADEALDPRALTIGFARRFATYKRAALLFSDLSRVKKLLGDKNRPVQLVFAGKAHPQDKGGKELIRSIVHASRDADLVGKVIFLEDYDMRIARALVSGVDVWLNTPRRPLEASGTSGMKAAANGALNVSVLDGWWDEARERHGWEVGWAIGHGEEYEDGTGDALEAEELYDLLEREVVPLFYDRDAGGLPRAWVKRMKAAVAELVPDFNTARMVREYAERYYVNAVRLSDTMTSDNLAGAKRLSAWKDKVEGAWSHVAVRNVQIKSATEVGVGDPLHVEAVVHLGALTPDDVHVELYYGPSLTPGALPERGDLSRMKLEEKIEAGLYRYSGRITTSGSGSHVFAARVVPFNDALTHPFETSLIRWG